MRPNLKPAEDRSHLTRGMRWTALVALLLFLVVSQLHAVIAHQDRLGLMGDRASLNAAPQAEGEAATPADECAVCVALGSAQPLPAFAILPPGDRTAKTAGAVYRYKPDTGWHAPLACRPPPFVV